MAVSASLHEVAPMQPIYLPVGAAPPRPEAIAAFLADAERARPDAAAGAGYEVRWIGLDRASTQRIFELIRAGDKTGTFTLPWIVERTGQAEPAPGRRLVLIDMDGTPTLLVRTTRVRRAVFGKVTAEDTAVDGSPVRDPAVWIPLHTRYWSGLLRPFGLEVSDDMPFWIETFELVYDAGAPAKTAAGPR
jgi:uncharacterized protein YhfF